VQHTDLAPHTVRVGDLIYRARVDTAVDTVIVAQHGPLPRARIQAAVTVTNVGSRIVTFDHWPGCFFTTLELWPTAVDGRSRRGRRTPAWDEERWRVELHRVSGVIVECDFSTTRAGRQLPPGASLTVQRDASSPLVRDVLGDSLPSGVFRAVLRVRPHTARPDARPTLRVAAGEVVIDASSLPPAHPRG
jgi:hypothetical protein